MDADTVKDLGAPIAMAVAMGYYIWRMTQFLLGAIAEGSSIDKIIGMAATVLAGMGYSISRGLSKKAS